MVLQSALAGWISREVAPWHTKLKLWETLEMWALIFIVFAYLANFSKVLQMRLPFQFNSLMLAWCSRNLSQMMVFFFFFFFPPLWLTWDWPATNSVSALHYIEERLNPTLRGSSVHFYIIKTQRKTIQSELWRNCPMPLNFVLLFGDYGDKIILALWIYSRLKCCLLLYWVVLDICVCVCV